MDLLLKNGLLVTDGLELSADIAIREGTIRAIGDLGSMPAHEVIDCTGRVILPGAVDLGLNLLSAGPLDPDSEASFALATREAAAGGVTTLIAAMECHPDEDAAAAIRAQAEADQQKAFVDFSYHLLSDRWDPSLASQASAILAEGVASFWLSQDATPGAPPLLATVAAALEDLSDDVLLVLSPWEGNLSGRCLTRSLERGTDLRDAFPEHVEASFLRTLAPLAAAGRARVMVNGVSGTLALRALAEAREATGRLSAACLLPHLVYPVSESEAPPRVWPPVRTRGDQAALFTALEEGLVSAVSAGHKPRRAAGESLTFCGRETTATGLATLSSFLPALHSEGAMKWRLSLGAISLCACADPAKLAGLYPRKGTLQIGADADLVILNPAERRLSPPSPSGAEYATPLAATLFQGAVEAVYLRGNNVFAAETTIGTPQGTFLRRRLALR